MVVAITGVLDDGSSPDFNPPVQPRGPLFLPAGLDVVIKLLVFGINGVPLKLNSGTPRLVLTVSNGPGMGPLFAPKVGTLTPAAGLNAAEFTLDSRDTKNLPPGQYVYDVWLTQDSKRNPIVPLQKLQILPAVG